MEAVVTVLDDQYGELVQQIWSELARDFGLRATATQVPIPHFTYQGATTYDRERVERALRQLAEELSPFTLETDGLGIFTGQAPVLYIPVTRSPALTKVHRRVWQAITAAGVDTTMVYAPERWIPHITLAQGDLTNTDLGAIVERFSSRQFHWNIPLTNFAVISNDGPEGTPYSLRFRAELRVHS